MSKRRYRVIIEPQAEADMDAAESWIAERAPIAAARWVDGLERAISSLEIAPMRCAIAPEQFAFAREIRHLLFGSYRVIFTIHEDGVHVLHIRHAARLPADPDEMDADGGR